MGAGGILTMEQAVCIVYNSTTQTVKCYSTVPTTLRTRAVLKVFFSANYGSLTLLMNTYCSDRVGGHYSLDVECLIRLV